MKEQKKELREQNNIINEDDKYKALLYELMENKGAGSYKKLYYLTIANINFE